MTNNFYNENAASFFNDTVDADLTSIYQQFLACLQKGDHIIDAGCGSGRDTHFFITQGYQVTAFDASEVLAAKASEYTGINVTVDTFENFNRKSPPFRYDAVWACASLLHVPSSEIYNSFSNLANQLKVGGIFYCSFKYGNDDIVGNGRYFTNADESRLSVFISNTDLVVDKTWVTEDVRPVRQGEKWLNAILIKEA